MRGLVLATPFLLVLHAAAQAPEDSRPPLFFREDWKEIEAATPVTQDHVANTDLKLTLYGPGGATVRKSHHDKPADDPYYVWSGECPGNWALTLRHKKSDVDLTGQAKIRWRAKQSGFRLLRIVVKTSTGKWYVSDAFDGPSGDWHESEFVVADIRWRTLDIDKIIEGNWAEKPDLSTVEEIGVTDLMPGGNTPASSRLDWIEIYGRAITRP